MQTSSSDAIRSAVRDAYGAVASRTSTGCCGPAEATSQRLGYSEAELAAVPDGADLGLGCGNPQAIAALAPGERVLDLGSGAGFDAFLAARQVGPSGRVVGVDLTPEMVRRARANAARTGITNVEFLEGDIERLPLTDGSVDVIMSNCVINLAPDKAAVFREAFRVLAPGGRLAISDIVAIAAIPPSVAADPRAYTGCVGGAAPVAELEQILERAGFRNIQITVKGESRSFIADWSPGSGAEHIVASAYIEAGKPVGDAPHQAGGPGDACCDSVLLDSCCPPEEKTACCGQTRSAARCGCQEESSKSRTHAG